MYRGISNSWRSRAFIETSGLDSALLLPELGFGSGTVLA